MHLTSIMILAAMQPLHDALEHKLSKLHDSLPFWWSSSSCSLGDAGVYCCPIAGNFLVLISHTTSTLQICLKQGPCCSDLQVGSQRVILPQSNYLLPSRHANVNLQLEPVGHSWYLSSPQRVHTFASSLLMTLQHVHASGFVHRDVRADNVVETPGGWTLIDWEMSGKEGAQIFWDSSAMPPGLQRGSQWFARHDLWQLGKLISTQSFATPEIKALGHDLQSGKLTAADGLACLNHLMQL